MTNLDLSDRVAAYRPDKSVLAQLQNVHMVAVVGPTAVGKTTLIDYAATHDSRIHRMVTDVSRLPRAEEVDGLDYNFRSRRDMLQDLRQGQFVQMALATGNHIYGSRASSYSSEGYTVMAVMARAMPAFADLPFGQLQVVCVIPPDFETWQRRIAAHYFTPAEYQQRLLEARESLQFAAAQSPTNLLINGDRAKSCDAFLRLVRNRTSPRYGQKKAEHVLKTILGQLEMELDSGQ
ncbi:MAG TPA: hypothetical protein VGS08_02375 [Candidatus Saccharimonadales bacterium]|nr:hypothetical protein [Candidatus Saccharimonadales bacterium]